MSTSWFYWHKTTLDISFNGTLYQPVTDDRNDDVVVEVVVVVVVVFVVALAGDNVITEKWNYTRRSKLKINVRSTLKLFYLDE